MGNTIFTATGCARCKITKRFMQKDNIPYEEFDFKAAGKDAFAQFYRANRSEIFRDKDGVEFPVFTDGSQIRQGVSVIIGHLIAGDRLKGFIQRSILHGEWIDGFNISSGDPAAADDLLRVLGFLKQNGLKLQLACNGKNSAVLAKLLDQGLGDRLIMEVKGPLALYSTLCGEEVNDEDVTQSIALASRFPQYEYFTAVAPLARPDGSIGFLTPEEIGATARLIEESAGSKKNPYTLSTVNHKAATDERFKSLAPLASSAMFKYRTAARRYQVMTEIQKQ